MGYILRYVGPSILIHRFVFGFLTHPGLSSTTFCFLLNLTVCVGLNGFTPSGIGGGGLFGLVV